MPYCWKCKTPYTSFKKKPGFHDTCDKCQSYWHSCCNCNFFTGYPSARCKLPNTEPVHDVEGANFCDEFTISEKVPDAADPRDPNAARKRWEQLFRD